MLLSAWSKKLLNEKGPASAGPFGWACGAGATTGCALDARQVPPGRFDVLDKPARCGPQVVADEGEAVAAAHEARGRLVVRQVGLAGDLEVPASFASRPYGRRQDGLGVVLQQDDGHSTRVKRERQDVAQSSHGDLVGGVAGAQPPPTIPHRRVPSLLLISVLMNLSMLSGQEFQPTTTIIQHLNP